jgi:DNA repair exonuclease SbcCD ATPase subunit
VTPFKIVLFAVIAILAGAVAMEHQSLVKTRADGEALRQQVDQLTPLIAENERLSNLLAQASSTPPDQVVELAKLRAQVVQLRGLKSQVEAAKQREAKSESEAAALRAQTSDMAKLQQENQQLQAANQANQAVRAQNACVNNLRLIDAAKQQWALENKKQTTDTPAWDDLKPYLGRGPNGEMPSCPSGGTYTVGTVGERPTCSVPGHALP